MPFSSTNFSECQHPEKKSSFRTPKKSPLKLQQANTYVLLDRQNDGRAGALHVKFQSRAKSDLENRKGPMNFGLIGYEMNFVGCNSELAYFI